MHGLDELNCPAYFIERIALQQHPNKKMHLICIFNKNVFRIHVIKFDVFLVF